jgi:Ca2+-binding RTX toxin-like protein
MALIRNPLLSHIDFNTIDYTTLSLLRLGTGDADTMRGGAGRDTFWGYGGNDTFIGNGGVDTFNGGEGTDTVDYSNAAEHAANSAGRTGVIVDLANNFGGEMGEASDTFSSIENLTGSNFNDGLFGDANVNVLRGLGGDDNIMGGAGGDTLDGGEGSDTLFYTTSNAGVTVDLRTNFASGGHATGDVISGFENISGSAFNDTLRGNGGDNIIEGGAGRDTLDGGAGLNDTVVYRNSSSGVSVNLGTNTASGGEATGDTVSGFENVEGSRNGDTLTGSALNNTILGGGGIDIIDGGRGADTIDGGAGNDIMTGGAQGDTFVFQANQGTGQDHIIDYSVWEDAIHFDIVDGTTPNVTFDYQAGADDFHVNVVVDFGNGSSVTLDNLSLIDSALVWVDFT